MSRSIDLIGEYKAAITAVTPAYVKRFGELGLVGSVDRIGAAGVARVADLGNGLYEPSDDGAMAVLLPVWDGPIGRAEIFLEDPDRLIDLVAWQPRERAAPLLSRRGIAAMLGAEAVRCAIIAEGPLRVFRDPGSWARAGGGEVGVVMVDWRGAGELLGFKVLVTDDVAHGVEVKARLKKLRAKLVGQVPRIRVPIEGATA